MKIIHIKNFRKGLATNSSSTHSIIYQNKDNLLKDLDIFELDYYGRCDNTIAASREAKIKYVLANIMYNDKLVEIMSLYYPEMKQYYPKIKKNFESEEKYYAEDFGMASRGRLYEDKNFEFNIDYLRYIIDTEDIAIVGGSDEQEFVYDTVEGHSRVPSPDDIYSFEYPYKKNGIIKNGNYYVGFGVTKDYDFDEKDNPKPYQRYKYSTCGRLRFCVNNEEPIPEYPELIDLRITNRCNNGCKFCFMDSNMKEKDADINFIRTVAQDLPKTEFSIGGGNVLLYPKLKEAFEALQENKHIINITINVKDIELIKKNKELEDIISTYVDGIGVSVFNVDDVKEFVKFEKYLQKLDNKRNIYTAAHIIPEYIGLDETVKIFKYARTNKHFIDVLFLGYKENGRGKNCEWHVFDEKEFNKIVDAAKRFTTISVDTTFGNRYKEYIEKNFYCDMSMTLKEGEFSMYIDGISQNAYKSSYQTDKSYPIGSLNWSRKWNEVLDLKEAFAKIRKDEGLESYKKTHYYD